MIIINEEKWSDIKNDFLHSVEYEYTEEPLIHFNYKTNQPEEIGTREVYEFSKNGMDFMLTLDKERRVIKNDSESKHKKNESLVRSNDELVYKLSIKFRDEEGTWKDSSHLEKKFD